MANRSVSKAYGDVADAGYAAILHGLNRTLDDAQANKWRRFVLYNYDTEMANLDDALSRMNDNDPQKAKIAGYRDNLAERAMKLGIEKAREDLSGKITYIRAEQFDQFAADMTRAVAELRTQVDAYQFDEKTAAQVERAERAVAGINDIPDLPDADTAKKYLKLLELASKALGDDPTALLEAIGRYGDKLPAYLEALAKVDDFGALMEGLPELGGRVEAIEKAEPGAKHKDIKIQIDSAVEAAEKRLNEAIQAGVDTAKKEATEAATGASKTEAERAVDGKLEAAKKEEAEDAKRGKRNWRKWFSEF